MQTFSRPQAAREIEARSRAKDRSARIHVVTAGAAYVIRSQSDPTTRHQVTRTGQGWVCSCRGFAFTGCCYHLGQLQRRADREGWHFGRVGPRPVA